MQAKKKGKTRKEKGEEERNKEKRKRKRASRSAFEQKRGEVYPPVIPFTSELPFVSLLNRAIHALVFDDEEGLIELAVAAGDDLAPLAACVVERVGAALSHEASTVRAHFQQTVATHREGQ